MMMQTAEIDVEKTSLQLRRLFDERNVRVADARESLGLGSVQSIYKWFDVRNKTLPTVDNLVRISEMFQVPLDDLIVRKRTGAA